MRWARQRCRGARKERSKTPESAEIRVKPEKGQVGRGREAGKYIIKSASNTKQGEERKKKMW